MSNLGSTRVPNATYQVSQPSDIFFWRKRVLKVYTIYDCSSHIGHEAWTI